MKKKFYHGIRPFRVGGNIHGIRKKKLYDIYIYIEQDIDRERGKEINVSVCVYWCKH